MNTHFNPEKEHRCIFFAQEAPEPQRTPEQQEKLEALDKVLRATLDIKDPKQLNDLVKQRTEAANAGEEEFESELHDAVKLTLRTAEKALEGLNDPAKVKDFQNKLKPQFDTLNAKLTYKEGENEVSVDQEALVEGRYTKEQADKLNSDYKDLLDKVYTNLDASKRQKLFDALGVKHISVTDKEGTLGTDTEEMTKVREAADKLFPELNKLSDEGFARLVGDLANGTLPDMLQSSDAQESFSDADQKVLADMSKQFSAADLPMLQRIPGLSESSTSSVLTIDKAAIESRLLAIYGNFNPDKASARQKEIMLGRLQMAGADVSNEQETLGPPPKIVALEGTPGARTLSKLIGLMRWMSAQTEEESGSGGDTEAPEPGTEKLDNSLEGRAKRLSEDPRNNFAEVKGDNEKHTLIVSNKAPGKLTADSLKNLVDTAGGFNKGTDADPEVLFTEANEETIGKIEKALEEQLNGTGADQMVLDLRSSGLKENVIQGVKDAILNTGKDWVSGTEEDGTSTEYIMAPDGTVYSQRGADGWNCQKINPKTGTKEYQRRMYYDKSEGKLKRKPPPWKSKYNKETRSYDDLPEAEMKQQKEKYIAELTFEKGEALINGKFDHADNHLMADRSYFVEVLGDQDDLHVRFNNRTGKWQIKEQDQGNYSDVTDDGSAWAAGVDDWSGAGFARVSAIHDALYQAREDAEQIVENAGNTNEWGDEDIPSNF